MGYCISQRNSKFHIAAKDVPLALKAIHNLADSERKFGSGGTNASGEWVRHWSWVDQSYKTSPDFISAMRCWLWEVDEDSIGDISDIRFGGEKIGDEIHLFNAIAPYVESGSFIEMEGEDGVIWRWFFKDGRMEEQEGTVVFPD